MPVGAETFRAANRMGAEVGDKYFIIDLNCRFGGQYPFSHLAGASFPQAIINLLLEKKITPNLLSTKAGTIVLKDICPVILKNNF